MISSASVAALMGLFISMMLSRVLGICYPGVQSLCRWVSVYASGAGLLLGSSAALLATFGGVEPGRAVALGCGVLVLGQVAGWLLFLKWLPDAAPSTVTDERMLLRSLANLHELLLKAGQVR